MKLQNAQYKIDDKSILNYYEIPANKPNLLLLHALAKYPQRGSPLPSSKMLPFRRRVTV